MILHNNFFSIAYCDDFVSNFRLYFEDQYAATPIAEGITTLHNQVICYLTFIFIFTVFIFAQTLINFRDSVHPLPRTISSDKSKIILKTLLICQFILLLPIVLSCEIARCMEDGNDTGGGSGESLLELLIKSINKSTASIQLNIASGIKTKITSFFTYFGNLFGWFKSWYYASAPASAPASTSAPKMVFPKYVNERSFSEYFNNISLKKPTSTMIVPELPIIRVPREPTILFQELPTILVPELPTIPTMIVPEYSTISVRESPRIIIRQFTGMIVPELPTMMVPELPTILAPELPTILAPELPTIIAPELPTIIVPEYLQNPELRTILGIHTDEQQRIFVDMVNILHPNNYPKCNQLLNHVTNENIQNLRDHIRDYRIGPLNLNFGQPFEEHSRKITELLLAPANATNGEFPVDFEFYLNWIRTDAVTLYDNRLDMDDYITNLREQVERATQQNQGMPMIHYLLNEIRDMYLEYIAHYQITGSFTNINQNVILFIREGAYSRFEPRIYEGTIKRFFPEISYENFNRLTKCQKLDRMVHLTVTDVPQYI